MWERGSQRFLKTSFVRSFVLWRCLIERERGEEEEEEENWPTIDAIVLTVLLIDRDSPTVLNVMSLLFIIIIITFFCVVYWFIYIVLTSRSAKYCLQAETDGLRWFLVSEQIPTIICFVIIWVHQLAAEGVHHIIAITDADNT